MASDILDRSRAISNNQTPEVWPGRHEHYQKRLFSNAFIIFSNAFIISSYCITETLRFLSIQVETCGSSFFHSMQGPIYHFPLHTRAPRSPPASNNTNTKWCWPFTTLEYLTPSSSLIINNNPVISYLLPTLCLARGMASLGCIARDEAMTSFCLLCAVTNKN